MEDFETAKKLFAEGLQSLEANNFEAAEMQFAKSLDLLPDRLSTLNNLSATKNRLKKFAEAEVFARKAAALDDKSPEAWSNLGFALARTNRQEEALQAYERALRCNTSYASAWLYKAMTLLELERHDEALLTCDKALRLLPSQYDILYTKSLILTELKRTDEALSAYLLSLDMRIASSPVYIAERRSTQKANILVVSPNPQIDASLKSLETLHLSCSNYPRQLAGLFHNDYHFTLVFERDAAKSSARKQIPPPDIVINNIANGEGILLRGSLLALVDLFDGFGVPVVNHPTKVVQTTRDTSAKLVETIPGVRVPKTIRFSSIGKTPDELVHEIEDHYGYPLITRTLFAQEGKFMNKIDSRDDLMTLLSSNWPEKFFITEFVDTRGGTEFYRKIRATIVNDEIIITRVDFQPDWNVRGRKSPKRLPFYLANLRLLEIEKQVCGHPEETLGKTAMQALKGIRDRIPLDVFGVDFDVNSDGLLVFYEANATMNLFSTAQKEVPNPKEAEEAMKLAFQRYFASLMNGIPAKRP